MKNSIKTAFDSLHQTSDPTIKVDFSFQSKNGEKKVDGSIGLDETRRPILVVKEVAGYNQKYITARLNATFKKFAVNFLPYVKSGDVVLTRERVSNPPSIGQTIVFSPTNYYYSVNGILSCNGRQFGQNYQAKYQGKHTETCHPDAEPVMYTQFILI